ncbi:MAG: helix-turn-helix domain-containing protein [Bacteriovoracaceae bacterium]|jgi:transcriptional regulator with XRE-family HTH domain|nr:helix-turn-helix domain-containing protein [Bacteriovoracaceae bacterium]
MMKIFIKSELEAKKLGANIQIARKRRKMSLVELAAKSSISKTVLSRIEAGDTSVGFGKVFNVLDALGLLTGLADLASPDMDRQQTMQEIKNLREGGNKSIPANTKKSNLVRYVE